MGWEKEGFLEEVSVAKSWQIEATGLVLRNPAHRPSPLCSVYA